MLRFFTFLADVVNAADHAHQSRHGLPRREARRSLAASRSNAPEAIYFLA